jgi:phosphoadenosine phosphosulfate reductase
MLSKDQKRHIENCTPEEGIAFLCDLFPGQVVFSTSLGQEDQVLLDMIAKGKLPVRVFTIDTGRMFNETYELLEKNAARYAVPVSVYFPESSDVEDYVSKRGINAFYETVDDRKLCCEIRKLRPLSRALQGAGIWITGLRSAQSENRKEMPLLEWQDDRELYKFNPLLHWSFDEVKNYLNEHQVPYNKLHDQGYLSIGCAPCTRAVLEGEDIRAGRWWWESSQKECGLHQVKKTENEQQDISA